MIEQEEPSLKGRFLPYKLQTGNFRFGGIMGFVVGLIILVASLWGFITFFKRTSDPTSHPILKALARFGPLEFVTSRIESELAVPHSTIGKLHLTNSWLVFESRADLVATRYEDVVWVYKHVYKQKSYGITVNKVFTAMVHDRFGVQCKFVTGRKEDSVNQMLEAISQRAPWAVMGYADELVKAWNKDRAGFLAAVERRKALG